MKKTTTRSVYMASIRVEVFEFFEDGNKPSRASAKKFSIGKSTMYRWFRDWMASQGIAA